MDTGQGGELLRQDSAFLFRDELAGFHGVNQQFQLRKVEEPLLDIIPILCGADHDNGITGCDHGLDVLLNRDPIGIEVSTLLQLMNDFNDRDV